jgi:IclR family transcriptional regulator, KDG regulon repressor
MREAEGKSPGVVDKVAALLMAFTFDEPELDLKDISKRVGLNKSTTCRILKNLASYHLVEQDYATGLYRLGIRLFELGSLVQDNLKLGEIARPYLQTLTAQTSESSHFAIRDGNSIVHLVRVESPKAIRAIPCRVGERYPVHCLAVGKAICAFLPDSERDRLLPDLDFRRHTDNTITNRSDFERELSGVKERGYALDNEEFTKGIKCVAAPVLGYRGQVFGAINIVAPAVNLAADRVDEMVPLLLQTAARISGYFTKDVARHNRVA